MWSSFNQIPIGQFEFVVNLKTSAKNALPYKYQDATFSFFFLRIVKRLLGLRSIVCEARQLLWNRKETSFWRKKMKKKKKNIKGKDQLLDIEHGCYIAFVLYMLVYYMIKFSFVCVFSSRSFM